MDRRAIERCADHLLEARRAGTRHTVVPEEFRPRTVAEGHRVQEALHARLAEAGWGSVVGFKIGATTAAMQSFLGVEHPCAGAVWSTTVTTDRAVLDRSAYVELGLEGELAVTVSEDIAPSDAGHDIGTVAAHVASWHAAIEVVDNRYGDPAAFGAPTLVADDFFGAGAVLGPPVAPADVADIAAVVGRMTDTGREVATGTGDALLGHPLAALAWLADLFGGLGWTIPGGSVVLLGSLVGVHWVTDESRDVQFTVDGLGTVEVSLPAP